MGLGLTIARRGIEQHGGQLSVTSQLGRGSIFRITLPPITQLNEVSIDNRLDVAHQQMLTYAKDMAQAIASERRMHKKLEQINNLSLSFAKKLNQFSLVSNSTPADLIEQNAQMLSQVQDLVRELIHLSGQDGA